MGSSASWGCGGAIDGGSIFASSSETALPTVRTFLTNHLAETAAIDFFTVPTATFCFFYLRRALAPSASCTALRGDRTPWFRLVLYPVRAHFAHTHFLRFLFLAPADLLFILQASVAHLR